MKVIEFYGLPGSGKSSVVGGVIEILNSDNVFCVNLSSIFHLYNLNKARKLWLSLVSLVMQPKLFYIFFKVRSFNFFDIFMVLYSLRLFYFGRTSFFKRKVSGCAYVVADQYLLQAVASLLVATDAVVEEKDLRYLVTQVSKGVDHFVFTNCDVFLSLCRVRNRGTNRSRFDFWSDKEALFYLERMSCSLRRLSEDFDPFQIEGEAEIKDKVSGVISQFGLWARTEC